MTHSKNHLITQSFYIYLVNSFPILSVFNSSPQRYVVAISEGVYNIGSRIHTATFPVFATFDTIASGLHIPIGFFSFVAAYLIVLVLGGTWTSLLSFRFWGFIWFDL